MSENGITGDQWVEKSQRGELWGVIGCMNPPTTQCPKCKNHYCNDHLGTHMHVVTDEETSDQNRRDESLR